MSLTASGWVFLFLPCLFLPLMAVRTAFRVRKAGRTPSRTQFLASFFVSQGMTLMLALSAAAYESITLFPPPDIGPVNLVIVLAFLLAALGTLPARWRWKP